MVINRINGGGPVKEALMVEALISVLTSTLLGCHYSNNLQ